MTAPWFRIANEYPNKRGPTIPFLLGALREPAGTVSDEATSRTELRALIVAMRDQTPEGHQAIITSCGTIGQLIVTVAFAGASAAAHRIPSPSNQGRGLDVEPIYGLPVVDVDSLSEELWRRHGSEILQGHFSWRGGEWREFDLQEREQIGKCLTSGERGEA